MRRFKHYLRVGNDVGTDLCKINYHEGAINAITKFVYILQEDIPTRISTYI